MTREQRNMKALPKMLAIDLVEAALDQPNPTEDLKSTLYAALRMMNHPYQPMMAGSNDRQIRWSRSET